MHPTKLRLRAPLSGVFAAALGCIVITAAPAATITNLFNTGVNNAGVALGLAGLPDPHYDLLLPLGYTAVSVDDTNDPFPSWYANDVSSRWIGPATNAQGLGGRTWIYQTNFTIPLNAILSTVSITGLWATDDFGSDIRINGGSTGQTNSGSNVLETFNINSGFIYGNNTLRFHVVNALPGVTNPTGLRIDQMIGTFQVVPEPATVFLTSVAAVFVPILCRRPFRSSA